MRHTHLAPLVVVGTLACTHHHPVRTTVAAHPVDEVVAVAYRDGRTQMTTARPGADGEAWLLGPDQTPVPAADIQAIRHVDRGRGALTGLGLGFASGAVAGGVAGWVTYMPSPCTQDRDAEDDGSSARVDIGPCLDFGPEGDALAGMLVGGLLGGLFGLGIGAGQGVTTRYDAAPSEGSTHVLVIPAPDGGMLGAAGAF